MYTYQNWCEGYYSLGYTICSRCCCFCREISLKPLKVVLQTHDYRSFEQKKQTMNVTRWNNVIGAFAMKRSRRNGKMTLLGFVYERVQSIGSMFIFGINVPPTFVTTTFLLTLLLSFHILLHAIRRLSYRNRFFRKHGWEKSGAILMFLLQHVNSMRTFMTEASDGENKSILCPLAPHKKIFSMQFRQINVKFWF